MPTVVVYEVHRLIQSKLGETVADHAVGLMLTAQIVALSPDLAVSASRQAHRHKLALADAIIYATAQSAGAELWTQDAQFERLPDVRYFPKP